MTSPAVLLADDQPHVVEALRLLLKPEGYRIDVAQSPAAILESVQTQTYDVVLMDLNYARDTTSGREGLDVINAIRSNDATTPIVVMTAWSTVALAVEAMQQGARDFIQKPWDNHRLLAIVRTQAELGRASRRAAILEHQQKLDLELASQVQRQLLPRECPDLLTLDCYAHCMPMGVVGGDYFDFIRIDENRIGVTIGDVAGKGVAAALVMASLQALLRSRATTCGDRVCQLMVETNQGLYGTIPANKYATLFYGVYREDQRSLTYVNAGHNPPLVIRSTGQVERLSDGGPVLGLFPVVSFVAGETRFESGDRLVLYTDGLTEALNEDGEEFGEVRLIAAATATAARDAASTRMSILNAHAAFAQSAPRTDDLTMLVAGAR
jgi:sigma-B regulation protein RsbU (phosphoserine phosphatase)